MVTVKNMVVQPSFVSAHILATYIQIEKKMRNRSRIELASNILEAANGGATKTKIMYKAFLSYAQLQEYLAMLTENSLLLRDGGIYKPTSKGIGFLQTTRQLNGLLEVQASQQK
ncbi:MAG TPA: winged helix-turn-helix domain-containing protein [Nitrososphaera sp.]|nr:winged helix-turn-helix domain-containing protein [Nitrososphaera sp.]